MSQNGCCLCLDILLCFSPSELIPNVLLQNSLNFSMLYTFKFECSKGISKLRALVVYFLLEEWLIDIMLLLATLVAHPQTNTIVDNL